MTFVDQNWVPIFWKLSAHSVNSTVGETRWNMANNLWLCWIWTVFGAGYKIQNTSRKSELCFVNMWQMTCLMCWGGLCVIVLVLAVSSYMMVSGCLSVFLVVFSTHNLIASVETCSKAPPLAATHDARRSSQSRSHSAGSCQERTAARAPHRSQLWARYGYELRTSPAWSRSKPTCQSGFTSMLQASWSMTRPMPVGR